jgi:hypothetical protein
MKNRKKYIVGGVYHHLNQNIDVFRQILDNVLSDLA